MQYCHLKILIWKEGSQYVSRCLNVEVASCGSTRKEAQDNLYEALELYFEDSAQEYVIEIKEV